MSDILLPALRSPLSAATRNGGVPGFGGLGPELVVNGDFSGGAAGWNLGVNWSVAGGELVAAAADPNTFAQTATQVITSGETYYVKMSCTAFTAGSWKLLFEGGANVFGDQSVTGNFVGIATATASGAIYIWSNALLTANFDNISVRKILS